MKPRVEVFLEERTELGEGPTWDVERQELVWVDILQGFVKRSTEAQSEPAVMSVGQPVGAAVRCSSPDTYLLALRDGFAVMHWEDADVVQIPTAFPVVPGN